MTQPPRSICSLPPRGRVRGFGRPGASEMTSSPTLARRLHRALTLSAAAVLLAACGGGTAQIEPFIAERLIVFGDEHSVLTGAGPQPEFEPGGPLGPDGPAGRRYGVNALNASDAVDCLTQPIWVQELARQYALVFAECNPTGATVTRALMKAQVGAKATDLVTQIDNLVAAGGFAGKDMSTVMVGSNDVLELYRQFPAVSEADLITEARRRGDGTGAQVNRLIGLGSRVLLVTAPDLGLSPYGLAEKAAHTDTDRSALLSRLTAAYNVRMRASIINDGRLVGLVLADEMVQAMAKAPAAFGLANATAAACAVALPDCNSKTLVTGGSGVSWLWADGTRMAHGGQARLGSIALARATGNPF